uniref:Cysteine synthase n=1 Tax=Solanum tuberosum TaxID=4113 RepID=M1B0C3_SOLTU
MRGTVKKAYELLESTPNAFMLQQFYNPANTQDHFDTTSLEIWEETLGPHQITGNGVGFKPDILDMDLMVEHRH